MSKLTAAVVYSVQLSGQVFPWAATRSWWWGVTKSLRLGAEDEHTRDVT